MSPSKKARYDSMARSLRKLRARMSAIAKKRPSRRKNEDLRILRMAVNIKIARMNRLKM